MTDIKGSSYRPLYIRGIFVFTWLSLYKESGYSESKTKLRNTLSKLYQKDTFTIEVKGVMVVRRQRVNTY